MLSSTTKTFGLLEQGHYYLILRGDYSFKLLKSNSYFYSRVINPSLFIVKCGEFSESNIKYAEESFDSVCKIFSIFSSWFYNS